MPADTAERWRTLCAQAARERDPEKLLDLATEINRLLDAQEQRLNQPYPDDARLFSLKQIRDVGCH